MKKKHIITLLFFLFFFGVVIMAMESFPKENIPLEELSEGGKVILSLKDKTASMVDSFLGENNNSEIDNNVVRGNTTEKQENIIIEKIITPTQEIVYLTKENTVEKIEQIIETITTPAKDTANSLAKQLIEWSLSLLSPEEIRDIFEKEFSVDICK